MDFENFVMFYLCKIEGLFISVQYSILDDNGNDWSCPDFIALDIKNKQVQIVEVTTAANMKNIIIKVEKKDEYWINKLKIQLLNNKIIDESWNDFIIRLFVREQNVKMLEKRFESLANQIKIASIESIAYHWNWPWPIKKKKQIRQPIQ